MANPNDELIQRFYEAFGRCDGDAMAACYAPGATFSDPVFQGLKDGEPGAMWRMLTSRATDLEIKLIEHEANGDRGSAHWLASYTFGQTGRHVDNDVHAEFEFADGLIKRHATTSASTPGRARRSARPGLLLGWTPIIKNATRKKARAGLDEFIAGAPATP